jgi:hypothetical protein
MQLIDTLSRLPASPGITCRGWSRPVPQSAMTVSAEMPTSADPHVASKNFTAELLAAGRLIAPLSQHPEEQEIAIFSGTLVLSVGAVAVPGLVNDVVLLAESGTTPSLPNDSDGLRQAVTEQVTDALVKPSVTIHSPRRFFLSSAR